MRAEAEVGLTSRRHLRVIPATFPAPTMRLDTSKRSDGRGQLVLSEVARMGLPQRGLDRAVNRWRWANRAAIWRSLRDVRASLRFRGPSLVGSLYLTHISDRFGRRDLGLAGCELVTTVFAEEWVDALIANQDMSNWNFHGIGTGATAPAIGDTDIETEITTQYAVDNTRPAGTQVENTSVIYQTVGTVTVDAAVACTEHGILDNATVGAGILMDRHTFAVVNLADGDSLQATFDLTVNAGG